MNKKKKPAYAAKPGQSETVEIKEYSQPPRKDQTFNLNYQSRGSGKTRKHAKIFN